MATINYSNVQHIKSTINQKTYNFRSFSECVYACYLEYQKTKGTILDWKYEPHRYLFKNATKRSIARSYLPDFEVTLPDDTIYLVEIKGRMDPLSRAKIDKFLLEYPTIPLKILKTSDNIFKSILLSFKKNAKKTII